MSSLATDVEYPVTTTPARAWLGPVLDVLLLVALAIYALAGVPSVPFNTDESAHILNSRDYADVFFRGDLLSLPVTDPRGTWRAFTRILDSTVSRYAFGLAWHLAGADESEVPSRPFTIYVPYEDNYAEGRLPSERVLIASRIVSTLFSIGSIVVFFFIARHFFNRPLVWLVTALYGLNPVMLMNTRRAMQEGSLLCFGLLVLLVTLVIVRRQSHEQPVTWRGWLALVLASSLALLSKNSAALFVAAGFGVVLLLSLFSGSPRKVARTASILSACGVVIIGLYVLFSPGLWADPIRRLQDVVAFRGSEITRITRDLNGPTPLAWRIESIFTQTYIAPVEFADSDAFRQIAEIAAQAAAYAGTPLTGLTLGTVPAYAATVFAILGLGVICLPSVRPSASEASYLVVAVTLIPVVLSLLVSPLSIQRYFLPLIPLVVLLTGFGLYGVWRLVSTARPVEQRTVAGPRWVAVGVLMLVLFGSFAYTHALHASPTLDSNRLLYGRLPETLRAMKAHLDHSAEYQFRMRLQPHIASQMITLSQGDTMIAQVGEDHFCLEDGNGILACFRYDAIYRLYPY